MNVRDVGGLPTQDGRQTRFGVLLRSDNLQGLTPADVSWLLGDFGLRTVLDLRTDGELHREGPGPLRAQPQVTHHQLSFIPHGFQDRDGDEAAAAEVADDRDVAQAIPDELPAGPQDMSGYYIGYLRDAPDNVAAALRLVADPASGPCLTHCAAGKDRTGVLVALVLSLVGVGRAAVVEDYLMTGERIAAIRQRLVASATYAVDVGGRTLDSMRPHAGNIAGFLDHVDADFGGPVALAGRLGVDAATLAALRDRLLH